MQNMDPYNTQEVHEILRLGKLCDLIGWEPFPTRTRVFPIITQHYDKSLSAKSKNTLLYVIRFKNKIVGYAIIAKKIQMLISFFSNIKIKIIFSMIKRFQLYNLLNAIISYFKLDTIFVEKKFKKIIKLNYNLNLLAIEKKFQSKGLGTFFLKNIFKSIKKSKYITVETVDSAATRFYVLRHNFKLAGNKLRFPKKQSILYKKII